MQANSRYIKLRIKDFDSNINKKYGCKKQRSKDDNNFKEYKYHSK
jgi:hypothetical protein